MPEAISSAGPLVLFAWVAGFFVALTIVNAALGFLGERLRPQHKIFAVALAPGQLRFELIGNVVFLIVTIATFTAVLSADVVRFGPEGFWRGLITFLVLMIGFQVFYWCLHRAMHTKTLIRIHAWHHRSYVTTPLSAQSMSFGESLGWMIGYVGMPLLLSMIEPISFFGWAAYMAFNVSGNIVGHSNVELAAGMGVSRASALLSNPLVYHALHHARGRGHYAFQAALMDRLLKTEHADWPALYARVSAGQALPSLKTRGDAKDP